MKIFLNFLIFPFLIFIKHLHDNALSFLENKIYFFNWVYNYVKIIII